MNQIEKIQFDIMFQLIAILFKEYKDNQITKEKLIKKYLDYVNKYIHDKEWKMKYQQSIDDI